MLVILELANNHGGSVERGKKIISEHHEVTRQYPQFDYAIKFQYRDLDTFIHPSADPDHKYVKRFRETNLSRYDRLALRDYAWDLGFKAGCTPFDEQSVLDVVKDGYDFLKIGSPSCSDNNLLEEVNNNWHGHVVASTGGASIDEVCHIVYSFGILRLTLMHCVSEYPTTPENLQLNQFDLFKEYFPKTVKLGFSSHERPNAWAIGLAVAKGATVFEWHITDEPRANAYSATAVETQWRLGTIVEALKVCGGTGRIPGPSPEQFKRKLIDGRMWWKP